MAEGEMRWMNSQSVRDALEALLTGLSAHDRDMGRVLDCRERVKRAEEELEKAERKFGETQAQVRAAQEKLREEGFLSNASVYEP